MKCLAVLCTFLLLSVSALRSSSDGPNGTVAHSSSEYLEKRFIESNLADTDEWTKNVNRGVKLLKGMHGSNAEAGALYGHETAQSIFDGDCKDSFDVWNYQDDTEALQDRNDKECDFDKANIKAAMDELGRSQRV